MNHCMWFGISVFHSSLSQPVSSPEIELWRNTKGRVWGKCIGKKRPCRPTDAFCLEEGTQFKDFSFSARQIIKLRFFSLEFWGNTLQFNPAVLGPFGTLIWEETSLIFRYPRPVETVKLWQCRARWDFPRNANSSCQLKWYQLSAFNFSHCLYSCHSDMISSCKTGPWIVLYIVAERHTQTFIFPLIDGL